MFMGRLLFLICVVVLARTTASCDVGTVVTNVQKCKPLPIDEYDETLLDSFCENVECNIKCHLDAFGDCYKQDAFVAFDPEVAKVTSRAVCRNRAKMTRIVNDCNIFSDECYTAVNTSVNDAVSLLVSGEFAQYKTEICTAGSTYFGCMVDGIDAKGGCTTEDAQFATDFMTARFSYPNCGAVQNHAFFTTYGGNVVCGAADHVMSCDVSTVLTNVQKCKPLPIDDYDETLLESFCENVECNIKCHLDAFGDCYKQDAFVAFDPEVAKVTSRAVCRNRAKMTRIVNDCNIFSDECYTAVNTSVNDAVSLLVSGEFAQYKTEICTAGSTYFGCIDAKGGCTTEDAQFAKDFMTARFSYPNCDAVQNHAFFTTYGGNVVCGAADHVMVTCLQIVTVLVALFTL